MITESQRKRIRSQLKNRRKTRPFKPVAFPKTVEMEYGKAIIKEVKKIDDLVKEILLPELNRLTSHKEERFDLNLEFRHLAGVALATALIQKIKGMFYGEILSEDASPTQNLFTRTIRRAIEPFLNRTKDKTETQFVKEFERQTGSIPIPEQINVDEFIQDSLRHNVSLIKTIPEQHFAKLTQDIESAVRRGELSTTLREKIEKTSKDSKTRARLIARDQIGKLVGNIEEARQRKLGVTEYIWRTSQDSRVRSFSNTNGTSDHKRLEGTIQKWSDPPVTVFRGKRAGSKNHPTQDIQCFIAGTMISTENGQKPIEQIKLGDVVHSHWGLQKVVETHKNHYEGGLIGVKFLHKTIWVTPGHKLFVNGKGWVRSDHLKIGDKPVKLEELFTCNFFHKEVARNIEHPHPHLIDNKSVSIGVDVTHTGLNLYNCIKFIKFKIGLIVNSIFAVRFFKNPLGCIFNTENIEPSSTINFGLGYYSSGPVPALISGGRWESIFSSFRVFNPLSDNGLATMSNFNVKMGKNLFDSMAIDSGGLGNISIRPKIIDIFINEPILERFSKFFLGLLYGKNELPSVGALFRAVFFAIFLDVGLGAFKYFSAHVATYFHRSSLFVKSILSKQLHYAVVGLESQQYNGGIFNFGVEKSMSYFADGVLVENCRCHSEAVYDDLTGIDHPNTIKARKKTEQAA